MYKLDWNRERYRTRDRLLEYDFHIYPAEPHSAGLAMVYPWENIFLDQIAYQLLQIARNHGYTGDEELFWRRFADGELHTATLETFPVPGEEYHLYLDTDTNILYYFRIATTVDAERLEENGGEIVGEAEDGNIYVYLPIRALLIENTIIDCGSAADYIG